MFKVAVGGKGGSGKTTISGILARVQAEHHGRVLAIDGDSNPNLALTLGLDPALLFDLPVLPKDLLEQVPAEDGKTRARLRMSAAEVVEQFGISAPGNVRLMVLGRIDHAGAGCMCRSHGIVRELLAALVAESDERVVVDLEAGLENFSRGTARHADTQLIVLEPYYKSLETARRIAELARELGIKRILGVANKSRTSEDAETMGQFAAAHGIELVATIPHDDAILEADRAGSSPIDINPNSPAVRAVRELAAML